MSTRKNLFTIDFINGTIHGSATAFKQAGKGSGSAYAELTKLMKQHPTFTCETVKLNVQKKKETYKGLTVVFMRQYLEVKGTSDLLKAFNTIERHAKEQKMKPYPYLKEWFLDQCSNKDGNFSVKDVQVELLKFVSESESKEAADEVAELPQVKKVS